jgi:FKBP-type peptidyl-prolyl cis-trans isomerase 2
MAQAKTGDTVKIYFKGSFEDGTVFEQTQAGEPLEFTIGDETVIRGLDKAVTGMNVGETRTVTVPPEEAYGPYRYVQVVPVKRSQLPPDIVPEVGKMVQLRNDDGEIVEASFKEVHDDKVLIDTNHPLAGKNLVFDIEVLEISEGAS